MVKDEDICVREKRTAKIRQYQESCNDDLVTELLLDYEHMVKMAARKISRNRPDLYEDLFQIGQMSLLRSFDKFDPDRGRPFEAYAMSRLIGHMKNFLRDKSWYIQVPRRIKEKGAQIQQAIDNLTIELGRSPEMKEIAERMELSEEETIEILAGRDYYQLSSLEMPLQEEGGSGELKDLVPDRDNPFQKVENRIALEQAFSSLDDMERTVLDLVFNAEQSQRSVAQQLDISQMSVSRVQKRAVNKLKESFYKE